PNTLPPAAAGVAYAAVSFSQSGGVAPVTWSSGALPQGMAFSNAGVLSGTPTTLGVFNLAVTVTDANGCSGTLTLPPGPGGPCPTMSMAPLTPAAGTAGAAYSAVTLSESGGVAPITWSLASGTLPAGMSLSGAGVISGTPSTIGTFPFTVQATDANGC